jgi:hypothetical protein
MIKANELRIGNWFDFNGRPMQVRPITINDIFYGKIYEPLPLTEEWLIKFGFEKTPLHYFKKDGIILSVEDFYYECFLGSNSVIIKYVHQLQNLYFALTGEELEVKETTNN